MFLVIATLSLVALGDYFFPDLSWGALLLISLACVTTFRLALLFSERAKAAQKKE